MNLEDLKQLNLHLDQAQQAIRHAKAQVVVRPTRTTPDEQTQKDLARKYIEDTVPMLDRLDGQELDLAKRGLRRARAILGDVAEPPLPPPVRVPPPPTRDDGGRSESGVSRVEEPELSVADARECQYRAEPGKLFIEFGERHQEVSTQHPVAKAIKHFYEQPTHRGIPKIYLTGDGGTVSFGGGYSIYADDSAVWQLSSGSYGRPYCEVVGNWIRDEPLDHPDQPRLRLNLGSKYGTCGGFKFHNLGIKGPSDSFIIRSLGTAGEAEFNGCWWLPNSTSWMHTSGAHLAHGYDHLIIRNWRINPKALFKEHEWYPKGGGPLYFLDNQVLGGVRTWFQLRPHVGASGTFGPDITDDQVSGNDYNTPRQTGVVVVRRNKAIHPQWDAWQAMGSPSGAQATLATIWNSLNGCYIQDNEFEDALGGCVVLAWQPSVGVGNYVTANGYTHRHVKFTKNKCTTVGGDNRPAVAFNACERAIIKNNEVNGGPGSDYAVDGETAYKWGAPLSNSVEFRDASFPGEVMHYDRLNKTNTNLSQAQFERLYG